MATGAKEINDGPEGARGHGWNVLPEFRRFSASLIAPRDLATLFMAREIELIPSANDKTINICHQISGTIPMEGR